MVRFLLIGWGVLRFMYLPSPPVPTMPFIALLPLVKLAPVVVKTATLLLKGGGVIGKVVVATNMKTAVAVGLKSMAFKWGAAKTIGLTIGVTMSVGAAVIIWENGTAFLDAINEERWGDSIHRARALLAQLAGLGGLGEVSDALHQFLEHHATDPSVVVDAARETRKVLDAIQGAVPTS